MACSHETFVQQIPIESPDLSLSAKIDSVVGKTMNQYYLTGLSIGLVKDDSVIYLQG